MWVGKLPAPEEAHVCLERGEGVGGTGLAVAAWKRLGLIVAT